MFAGGKGADILNEERITFAYVREVAGWVAKTIIRRDNFTIQDDLAWLIQNGSLSFARAILGCPSHICGRPAGIEKSKFAGRIHAA